jgi:hypothetical protein
MRKKLTSQVHYTCDNKNALDVIYDLLALNSNIVYNDTYFNTTEWDIARTLAPNITISMDSDVTTEEINTLIEIACASCFGLFIIQPDNRYTFKMIDTSATATTTISKYDILTDTLSIDYDPSQVLSSIAVSYDKVNNVNDNGYQTILTDLSYEQTVFNKYKVYREQGFSTYLPDSTAAQAFATKLMEYAKDVHGITSIDVPMKYYSLAFGGVVDVELNRENAIMLGTKKCEILGKTYNLENENINLLLRIV